MSEKATSVQKNNLKSFSGNLQNYWQKHLKKNKKIESLPSKLTHNHDTLHWGIKKKKNEENSKYFKLFYSSTRVTDKGETLRFKFFTDMLK